MHALNSTVFDLRNEFFTVSGCKEFSRTSINQFYLNGGSGELVELLIKGREETVLSVHPLIVKQAVRYCKGRSSISDFVQEGYLAAYRAFDLFKPEACTKFSSYAFFWIRSRLLKKTLTDGVIRLPDSKKFREAFPIKWVPADKNNNEDRAYDSYILESYEIDIVSVYSSNCSKKKKLAKYAEILGCDVESAEEESKMVIEKIVEKLTS